MEPVDNFKPGLKNPKCSYGVNWFIKLKNCIPSSCKKGYELYSHFVEEFSLQHTLLAVLLNWQNHGMNIFFLRLFLFSAVLNIKKYVLVNKL